MTKADKMLLKCGYEITESPFDDWFNYRNNHGVEITFQDDFKYMHCAYEINYSIHLIEAIHEKMKELGWIQ